MTFFHAAIYFLVEPIVIEDGEFSWDGYEGASILSNINMRVNNSNALVAIVGHVGSGKSSFLSAILGEMYKQSGYVNTTVNHFIPIELSELVPSVTC